MAAPVEPNQMNRDTVEFKIQVVELVRHRDIQTQDVAKALECHPAELAFPG